jgi:hypothetical protein
MRPMNSEDRRIRAEKRKIAEEKMKERRAAALATGDADEICRVFDRDTHRALERVGVTVEEAIHMADRDLLLLPMIGGSRVAFIRRVGITIGVKPPDPDPLT